jgi:hypothetical protein
MKKTLLALPVLMLTPIPTQAANLYVAVFHLLTTKGTYEKNIIKTTEHGVAYKECMLRKDAWWAEMGPGFEAMKAQLAQKGQHTEFSLSCERKNEVAP